MAPGKSPCCSRGKIAQQVGVERGARVGGGNRARYGPNLQTASQGDDAREHEQEFQGSALVGASAWGGPGLRFPPEARAGPGASNLQFAPTFRRGGPRRAASREKRMVLFDGRVHELLLGRLDQGPLVRCGRSDGTLAAHRRPLVGVFLSGRGLGPPIRVRAGRRKNAG